VKLVLSNRMNGRDKSVGIGRVVGWRWRVSLDLREMADLRSVGLGLGLDLIPSCWKTQAPVRYMVKGGQLASTELVMFPLCRLHCTVGSLQKQWVLVSGYGYSPHASEASVVRPHIHTCQYLYLSYVTRAESVLHRVLRYVS
jgi:hypothetical protein